MIDDRTSGNLKPNLGTEWCLITDQVMGGISSGKLTLDTYKCKRQIVTLGDHLETAQSGVYQNSFSP